MVLLMQRQTTLNHEPVAYRVPSLPATGFMVIYI
jgi:hypothetical protein